MTQIPTRIVKLVFLLAAAILLISCGQVATSVPPFLTPTPTPVPSSATVAPAWIPSSMRTPVPSTTSDGIPERIGDGWEVGSLTDAGIDSSWIEDMLDSIYRGEQSHDTPAQPNSRLKYQKIDGILIVKDGRLVLEEYFNGYTRDFHHDVTSVNKSITAFLVGIAIEQGRIGGVSDKVLQYFPKHLPLNNPDVCKESITIEDLLTMRNGRDCDDWDPQSASYYQKQQPSRADEIQYILNLPMQTQPGSHYSYCTWGVEVLNALLMDTTGMQLSEFAEQNLFQPLGINDARWHRPVGNWNDIDGVAVMLPRDMAKLGQLILQNGNWNGKQVVPQAWIEQSTRKHVSLPFNSTWGRGYGYLWWVNKVPIMGRKVHSFAASGHGGQVIAIFPDLDTVVVITGSNYENDEGQPFELMEKYILPAVMPP